MLYNKKCDHCGHVESAYTHALNQGLVSAFKDLCEFFIKNRRGCNLASDLNLTHNQMANFQKLRHFGIVSDTPAGWFPTELGAKWYRGEVRISNPAASLSNEPLPTNHAAWGTHKGKRIMVLITDYVEINYKKRDEYASEKASRLATASLF